MIKHVAAVIAKLGENMGVPRFVRYAGKGYVGQYMHLGGKIGVQVEVGGVTPEIAGARGVHRGGQGDRDADRGGEPGLRARDEARQNTREGARHLPRADGDSGKPANVLDKIIEGKLGSYYKQAVLTDQDSIRDPKQDDRQGRAGGSQ